MVAASACTKQGLKESLARFLLKNLTPQQPKNRSRLRGTGVPRKREMGMEAFPCEYVKSLGLRQEQAFVRGLVAEQGATNPMEFLITIFMTLLLLGIVSACRRSSGKRGGKPSQDWGGPYGAGDGSSDGSRHHEAVWFHVGSGDAGGGDGGGGGGD